MSDQTTPRKMSELSFSDALVALKDGFKINRDGSAIVIIVDGVIAPRFLFLREDQHPYAMEYNFSSEDIIANDWKIIF